MSKIDELIKKLCPYGVEYKKLEDISTFERGKGFKKEDKGTGDSPIIFYGELYTTYGNYIDEIVSFVDEKKVANKIYANKEDIVLPISSTTAEAQIGKASVVRVDRAILGSDAIVIHNNINSSYLMYYINSKIFEFYKMKCVSGTTIRHLAPKEMMQIKVAVPPLEVQCEIVHILDDFTLLSAELSAELKARQKQYDFYKQKVFDSIKTKKIKHITDIALVKARVGWQRLTKSEYLNSGNYYLITGTDFTTDGNINFESCVYVSKDRYEMDKNIQVHKDDILITKDGTLGKVAILKEEPSKETTLNSGVFRIKVLNDKEVYPKYLYHFFTSKYFKDFVESVKTGSTIPHLTQQGLVTLDIPIPSLEEQIKLSGLLDNFDILTNDITEGLPAEIETRRKQYEYYRDKLLTFKELVNEG